MHYIRAAGIEDSTGFKAGFSTRAGGVSRSPFSSLNLSLSSGDSPGSVGENRRLLCNQLGFSADRLAIAGLVHGNDVAVVNNPGLITDVDGLVTTVPDILLCLTAADCAIVLLADGHNRVVGACHAGWRGAVAGVVGRTIARMTDLGGSVRSICAFVSPCISQANFEVGDEVAVQFESEYVVRNTVSGKAHVDLRGAIASQLLGEGLRPENIEVNGDCTVADTSTYFSYRAENGTTGRMMGFIGMSLQDN